MWKWITDNIIALIALCVSIGAAWYSKKQTDLNRKGIELEEQREKDKKDKANQAMIIPRFTTDQSRTGRQRQKLSIFNEGAAEARNIRIRINGDTPTACPDVLRNHDKIEVIAPNNHFDYLLAKDNGSDAIWRIEVTWDDAYSKNRRIETELGI